MFEECFILHLAQNEIASAEFQAALKSNDFRGRYEHAATLDAAESRILSGARPNIIVAEGGPDEKLGGELLAWFREPPRRNGIPVVVYSPLNDEQQFEAALQAGAVAYLIKKGDFQESVERVRRILEFCDRAPS